MSDASPDGEDAALNLLREYFSSVSCPAAILAIPRNGQPSSSSSTSDASRQGETCVYHNSAFPSSERDAVIDIVTGWYGRTDQMVGTTDHGSRTWRMRRLRNQSIVTVEDVSPTDPSKRVQAIHANNGPLQSPIQYLLLPSPSDPKPYPQIGGPDLTSLPPAALAHNDLFLSLPWAAGPLGPINQWTPQLRGLVQIMMTSPFPVLISYGPEYVLLYNEPYSKVIGKKHPSTLGMKYGEAWPEVWGALEPSIQAGYQGQMLNVECQEMFLLRGEKLEETYFSYSLIPIRDGSNSTCGLYIPNFDNTVRMITERRIRSLHHISARINRSLSQVDIIQDALEGMKSSNSRDMHFALFYSIERADKNVVAQGIPVETDGWEIGTAVGHSSSTSRTEESTANPQSRAVLRLAGSYGVDGSFNSQDIPLEFASGPGDESSASAPEQSIMRFVRQARETDTTVLIPDLSALPLVQRWLNGNPFDEPSGAAIVLPIRSSSEDRLHGVMVLGLNTRLPYDEEYSNYIHLVRGLLATGLATIKLHEEDLSRARYLAALNRQKNEELQSLLKHKTKELKTSELKFRSAFASCPAAIWIASAEGELWDMNEAHFRMSGLSKEAPLGDWITRVHPEDYQNVKTLFDSSRTRRIECEFRFIPTDAELAAGVTEKWVEATVGPVRDETGTVVMISGALLDVTLRRNHLMNQTKRADEALELKRLQDHFIDMLSHELRNPLSAICLSSDGVVDSLQSLEPRCSVDLVDEIRDIVKDAGVIKLCTVHMRRLVDDVLALSKIDSNVLVITPVPSQIEAVCLDVFEIVKTEMLTNDIICSFEVKPGYRDLALDWVDVDHSRVRQILINLLTNAIKFTSLSDRRYIKLTLDATTSRPELPGPRLVDATTTPHTKEDQEPGLVNLVFEIIDSGVGMGEEDVQRLFKRFVQASDRTHLTYGGSGLGLFICRRIAHLLGGEISVQSRLGEGSTFTFYIPVRPSAGSISDKQRSSGQSLNMALLQIVPPIGSNTRAPSLTSSQSAPLLSHGSPDTESKGSAPHLPTSEGIFILLVEDNDISQKLLRKQLIRAGCTVATANDGVEAIEYVVKNDSESSAGEGRAIDVILMDIEMPRKGGIEATRDIKAMEADGTLLHRTPIIAVTANARLGQIQLMLDAGMDAAVSKPFVMPELLRQIEGLTGKRIAGSQPRSAARGS